MKLRYIKFPKKVYFVLLAMFLISAESASAQNSLEDRQIVASVFFSAKLSPNEIIDIVNDPASSGGIKQTLGNPIMAEFLFGRLYNTQLPIDEFSPVRVASRYIILTYNSGSEAIAALPGVSAAAQIDIAYMNSRAQFSTVVTDELVADPAPTDPLNTNFMWHAQLSGMAGVQDAWSFGPGWLGIGFFDGAIDLTHPDLLGSQNKLGSWYYDPGPSSSQGTREIQFGTGGVHGMLTTGLALARANNPRPLQTFGQGTAGMCPGCRLLMQAGYRTSSIATGLTQATLWGASVANYSGGVSGGVHPTTKELIDPIGTPCVTGAFSQTSEHAVCAALKIMARRDVMFFASAGNFDSIRQESGGVVTGGHYGVQWPAREPFLTYAVGGTHVSSIATGDRWTESFWGNEPLWDVPNGSCPGAGYNFSNTNTRIECGSNYGPELDFAAPARDIISISKPSAPLAPGWCSDDNFGAADDGVRYCRGTSFSSPIVAGGAALLRSINPLLRGHVIANVMKETTRQSNSGTPVFNNSLGYGVPNFGVAAKRILGRSNGAQVNNRLTPVFYLTNEIHKDNLYTASPQVAVSAIAGDLYRSILATQGGQGQSRPYGGSPGRLVGRYVFPDVLSPSNSAPYTIYPPGHSNLSMDPTAYFNTFTGDKSVFGVQLRALYRLATDEFCDMNNSAYATAITGPGSVAYFTSESPINFCDPPYKPYAYSIEGIEGYVMESCPSQFGTCSDYTDMSKPQGLYLRYSLAASEKRFALLLGSQLSWSKYSTYLGTVDGGTGLLGYVFPHWDSDVDYIDDGFERLIGTNRFNEDTDCDAVPDRAEFPVDLVQNVGSDPVLGGSCGPQPTASVSWTTSTTGSGGKVATYTISVVNPSSLPTQSSVDVVFIHGGKRKPGTTLPAACRDWTSNEACPDCPPYLPWTQVCNVGTVNSGTTKQSTFSWEVSPADDSERASVRPSIPW